MIHRNEKIHHDGNINSKEDSGICLIGDILVGALYHIITPILYLHTDEIPRILDVSVQRGKITRKKRRERERVREKKLEYCVPDISRLLIFLDSARSDKIDSSKDFHILPSVN